MYIHKNGICLRKIERSDLPKLKELKNESWFGTHHVTFLNDYDQEKWCRCKRLVKINKYS